MSFIQALGPQMTITVSPEQFTCSAGGTTVTLSTFLCVEPGASPPRVLAVGEMPAGSGAQNRLDLFGGPDGSSSLTDRMWALEAFFRHAIRKTLGVRAMLRPAVTVTGIETLDHVLHGYQATVLTQALIAAGARQVDYPEMRRAA